MLMMVLQNDYDIIICFGICHDDCSTIRYTEYARKYYINNIIKEKHYN